MVLPPPSPGGWVLEVAWSHLGKEFGGSWVSRVWSKGRASICVDMSLQIPHPLRSTGAGRGPPPGTSKVRGPEQGLSCLGLREIQVTLGQTHPAVSGGFAHLIEGSMIRNPPRPAICERPRGSSQGWRAKKNKDLCDILGTSFCFSRNFLFFDGPAVPPLAAFILWAYL